MIYAIIVKKLKGRQKEKIYGNVYILAHTFWDN